MKRICFVIPSFIRGGVETVTLNILNSLDYSKFDCTLIICTGNRLDNQLISKLSEKVRVTLLEKENVRASQGLLFKKIKAIKPHIVFSSFNHLSLLLIFFKKFGGLRYNLIPRLNTLPYNRLKSNYRDNIYNYLFSKLLKYAKIIIAQSAQMKLEAIDFYRLNPSKVVSIPNIVDIRAVLSAADEDVKIDIDYSKFNLIAVGSLGHVKGYDILLAAIRDYKNKWNGDNIHIYIIGDNREKTDNYGAFLQKLVTDLDIGAQVSFLGFQVNPHKYMSKMNGFILPSRREGFPNVVLEALILGLPCLVTNCVDFTDIIQNGSNGIIVDKEDPIALSNGLKNIQNIQGKRTVFENFDYNSFFNDHIL